MSARPLLSTDPDAWLTGRASPMAEWEGERFRPHQGGRGGRAYVAWRNMIARTHNPALPGYKNYGGRGISVAPQWLSFVAFLADMGEPPAGCSLERINNEGSYGPGNCRWATRREQSRNTRRNVWVFLDGERLCVKDALARLGYSFQAFRYVQIHKGWDAQKVIDAWLSKPDKCRPFDGSKPRPPTTRGEQSPASKLTTSDVLTIRRQVAAGASPTSLARHFGVNVSLIGKIRRREVWAHV